jgi:glycosyltransferase involved in cell wall biosynthesis
VRVVLDCRCIHRRMGGIGRGALALVRSLSRMASGHQLSVIVGAGHEVELGFEGVTVITVDAAMIDERFDQLILPNLLLEMSADLYLNLTFAVPVIKTTRLQAAFIHDVSFEDCPELVEPRLRDYLSRWSKFTAAHADHVVTISEHARGRIREVYGVPEDRITRIYFGIEESAFLPPEAIDLARVKARFGIDAPYILYLGAVEPKKGISQLLAAFRKAIDLGLVEDLIVAGPPGAPIFDVMAQAKKAGCADRVRTLGFIEDQDKKPLMASASLFAFPSLYEGFGLPPLEAMALGVPCIVSDQTSLPEIAGEVAIVTNVFDLARFAADLVHGVRDQHFRRNSGRAGPDRARAFSWHKSAAELLNLCVRLGRN